MPVWDWDYLPGLTNTKGSTTIVKTSFVGSETYKESGLSAMDYKLAVGTDTLSAHKIWAAHDDMVVCLIADLKLKNKNAEIYITLDQCKLDGFVRINDSSRNFNSGLHNLKNVKWIFHDGIAYIPLKPAKIMLKTGVVKGTWRTINRSGSNDTITDKLFMPVLMHRRDKQSFGYILTASENAADTKKLHKNLGITVMQNDRNCQAVKFKDGTLMVAFFNVDNQYLKKEVPLRANRPCLIILN